MKADFSDLDYARVKTGDWKSDNGDRFGAFTFHRDGAKYLALASCGMDGVAWEHVSVSKSIGPSSVTPTWDDMTWIKDKFWEPEECVLQLHPPKSQYVNVHRNCLHLWRPTDRAIPIPPQCLV